MFNQAGLGLTPPFPLIRHHSSLGLCLVCLVRTTKEASQIPQTRQTGPVPLVPQAALLACFFHTRSLLALARIIHERFCYNR